MGGLGSTRVFNSQAEFEQCVDWACQIVNDAGMHSPRFGFGHRRAPRRPRALAAARALCAGAVVGLAAGSAWAQAAPPAGGAPDDPFAGVEEMIVTGSGMTSALTATSTAVTAFDAMKLEALGVSNVADVAAYTPNLEIRSVSATTATFFIRGVGLNDFTANAASAVAVYVDEAPRNLPAIQLGLLYDLNEVAIQKGPQGSGPGRNASAGAIRISTKKPTGEYGGYLSVDYGNYNLIDVEGALEVPILEDALAVRTAFRRKTRDGIVTNRCGGFAADDIQVGVDLCGETPNQVPGNPPVVRANLEEDLNNTDIWSSRTSLRWQPPVDDMEWNLVGHVDRLDQLGTVGQHLGTTAGLGGIDGDDYRAREVGREAASIRDPLNIPPRSSCSRLPAAQRPACLANINALEGQAARSLAARIDSRPLDKLPFEGDYNNPGFERQTSFGFTLAGDWQIGAVTLKNITGFERYDRERLIDADYSPNVTFEFDIEDDAWQVTEDLRLSGELESLPMTWGAGAFYLEEELDYVQDTLASEGPVEPIRQQYVQDTRSFGIYGDLSYDLLDDLTLEGGIRYNWESKQFSAAIFRGEDLQPSCIPSNGINPPCQRTETVDHPTGTLSLNYHFDEHRDFYIKYSHGWKGPQFNARDGTVASEVTDVANPEVIDAMELGFKASAFDDILTMDGAIFWYAYQNYQVFFFTNVPNSPPVRIVLNANDALNFGAELTTTVRPVEGLTADLRFGWLETRFLDFTSAGARTVPGSVNQTFLQVFDYNGNQLPNAPRFKISASLEYALDLDRFGTLTPRYDLSWTDDVNFDPSGGHGAPDISGQIYLPNHAIGQKAFALHNLGLRYTNPSENLEIGLWIRNLTNEVYKTLAFDASIGPGFVGNLVGDPRTYGLTAKVTF